MTLHGLKYNGDNFYNFFLVKDSNAGQSSNVAGQAFSCGEIFMPLFASEHFAKHNTIISLL